MGRLSIEERISRFLIGISIVSLTSLWVRLIIAGYTNQQIIDHPSIGSLSISICVLFITMHFPNSVKGVIQVVLVSGMCLLSAMDDFTSWYSMGLLAIAIILSVKYGYFKNYLVYKVALLSLFLMVGAEYRSSMAKESLLKFFGIETMIFYIFFIGIIYICYKDEEQSATDQITQLKKKKEELEVVLEALSKQIEELEKKREPFDLSACALTQVEMEILQCLVHYQANDIEISKILNKPETTIGLQLKSIYQKLGVEDRDNAIRICKYNFS